MARVATNTVSVAHAIEVAATPGILAGSPVWFRDEPNQIDEFGAKIKTVVRRPISRSRQLQKGTIVDLDSSVAITSDLTMDFISKHLEGVVYAEYVNSNLYFPGSNASSSGYTISAATASQAGKIQWSSTGPKTLVFGFGYVKAANNGLKVLTADTATSGTLLAVSGTSLETAPSNAVVAVCGVRPKIGDLAIVVSGGVATLTSGNNGVSGGDILDFTTLGLTVGQFIHVGGTTSATQFSSGLGFFRITSIAAGTLVGDKVSTLLVTDTGAGASEQVDLLFGRFLRNVSNDVNSDDNRYLERTLTFELATPNLAGVGVDGYQYATGNYYNTLELNFPETDKVTAKVSFLGFDTAVPTGTRQTNAATPVAPIGTTAFNTTSSYIANLRTSGIAASGTLFKNWKMTIQNSASPEKVQATLGAAAMDIGQFVINMSAELIFADPGVPTNIRNNATLTFDFMMKNGDGGFAFDFPSLTFGDGQQSFLLDKSVRINVTFNPFADATINTSIGISLFPVLP